MSSVAQASIVAHGPLVCYLCRLIHCENWVLSIVFEKVRGTTLPKNFEMGGGGNINFINFTVYFLPFPGGGATPCQFTSLFVDVRKKCFL